MIWISFHFVPDSRGALYNLISSRWQGLISQPEGNLMGQNKSDLLSTIIEAFNYSKDGIAIVTIDGTLLYYNRVWVEIHALDSGVDYTGQRLRDVEREEILPLLDEGRESLLSEGFFIKQFGTTRRDGKHHVVHVVASLVEHLSPPLVVIVLREVTDIVEARKELEKYRDKLEELVRQRTSELTQSNVQLQMEIEERKRAESATTEATEKFREIIHGMPVMMDAMSETGVFLAWNMECERVTGYSAEEIVGNPKALEMLYPEEEYREKMMRQWASFDGDVRDWELDITCKDGSVKAIAWSNLAEQVPIPGWFTWAIGVDVTEWKKAEKALHESENKMRAQLKGIPVPTYTWQHIDDDFILLDFNDAAFKITEGTITDYIGIKANELYKDQPEILKDMHECCACSGSRERVMEYSFKSIGKKRYLNVKYACIQPSTLIVHTEDITERKETEEELERYRTGLEELVDERTIELQRVNKQLQQEILERKRTEMELESRNRELGTLNEIYKIIVAASDVNEILDRILEPIMEFCKAELGGLYFLDYDHNRLELVSSRGLDDKIVAKVKAVEMSVRSVQAILGSSMVFVAEEDLKGVSGGQYDTIKEALGVKRTLTFPFKSQGRIAYLVMLGRLIDEDVPSGIRRFLEMVGNQISIAVERLELLSQLEKSKIELKNLATRLIGSIEEEKRNIALSLHDETSQTLAAVKNELEMLRSRIPAGDKKSKKSLEEIGSHIMKITEGTRRISYSLHPSQLEDLGLVPAINWYAEKFVRSKQLKVEVGDAGFNEELPLHVGLTLYRIAQEALANVVRHANAKNVEVNITKGYPNVIMVIKDDGKGFISDAGPMIEKGLGIIGMRERVEGMDGSFQIRSSPGKGTRIRVTLPLEDENDG